MEYVKELIYDHQNTNQNGWEYQITLREEIDNVEDNNVRVMGNLSGRVTKDIAGLKNQQRKEDKSSKIQIIRIQHRKLRDNYEYEIQHIHYSRRIIGDYRLYSSTSKKIENT